MGEVHAENAPVSSLHSNEATPDPTSVPLKEKLALAEFESALGEDVIVVSGAVASIVTVREAGVVSAKPPATPRTANECDPVPNVAVVNGLAHAVNGAPSTEHSNEAGPAVIVNPYVTVGVLTEEAFAGPLVIVVSVEHAPTLGPVTMHSGEVVVVHGAEPGPPLFELHAAHEWLLRSQMAAVGTVHSASVVHEL